MALRSLLLCVVVLLAACGGKDDVLAPAALPDIRPEVKFSRLWSVDVGTGDGAIGARLEPAVTARAVYAADGDGYLVARDRASGDGVWRVKTSYAFSAGPVAAYGQLFAGTREGELVAFSADNGAEAWKVQLGGEVLAPPVVDADSVLVKSSDGRISLFDRTGGSLRWVHDGGVQPLALRASSRPMLLADAAIAGLSSGLLVALDRASGQMIWERRIAEPDGKSELDRMVDVAGDFLLVGDRLHAASYQGRIVAMDLRSGQFAWQQPLSTFQPLAAADGIIFAVDSDSRVVAWRAADGVLLWRQEALLARGLTGCAVLGKYLLTGDYEGYLHVLRQADGVIVGRKRIDRAGVAVTPVVDEGVVFVQGRAGKLAAMRIE